MTGAGFAAHVAIYANGEVVASATAGGPGQTATATFDVPYGASGVVFVTFSGGPVGAAYTMRVR